eukprot:GILK01004833.1.p1 GENE.GILK01004833.1~~GILK01004833.1.p1  ORF type:complete len:509 (-),score=83.29 GILK01004833.1:170-1660(-)
MAANPSVPVFVFGEFRRDEAENLLQKSMKDTTKQADPYVFGSFNPAEIAVDPSAVVIGTSPSTSPTQKPATTSKSWASVVGPATGKGKGPIGYGMSASSIAADKSHQSSRKSGSPAASPASSSSHALENFQVTTDLAAVRHRGMVNTGNVCFLNSVLQALIHCPPFYRFVHAVSGAHAQREDKPPAFNAFSTVLKEFEPTPTKTFGDPPVSALTVFGPLLRKFHPIARQEDAQEFLAFLLDTLHEELRNMTNSDLFETAAAFSELGLESTRDDDEWEEVGKKGRKSVLNVHQEFSASPITKIFGGKLRSSFRKQGSKSSVTFQPFLTLHLDIRHPNIRTVDDALAFYFSSERLEDFISQDTQIQVSASKQITIESLPPVLVLHLKRFSFEAGGRVPAKLSKAVQFGSSLTLSSRDISKAALAAVHKPVYQLFAVVAHHGREAVGGHYTCASKTKDNRWFHFDDANVTPISEAEVLGMQAYLLFYVAPSQVLDLRLS